MQICWPSEPLSWPPNLSLSNMQIQGGSVINLRLSVREKVLRSVLLGIKMYFCVGNANDNIVSGIVCGYYRTIANIRTLRSVTWREEGPIGDILSEMVINGGHVSRENHSESIIRYAHQPDVNERKFPNTFICGYTVPGIRAQTNNRIPEHRTLRPVRHPPWRRRWKLWIPASIDWQVNTQMFDSVCVL